MRLRAYLPHTKLFAGSLLRYAVTYPRAEFPRRMSEEVVVGKGPTPPYRAIYRVRYTLSIPVLFFKLERRAHVPLETAVE